MPDTEKLSPDRAVRLLRAKAAEMERRVLSESPAGGPRNIDEVRADIALIASLLADHIESYTS